MSIDPVLPVPGGSSRFPLTWSQEMYWYMYHMPLPVVDSVKIAVRIPIPGRGVPERSALAAVRALVNRHEALRTVCPTDASGIPFQLVLSRFEEPVPLCRNGNRPQEVQAVIDLLAGPPMDQATELPLRVGFALDGGRVATIVLLLNHIAVDAPSNRILRDDVLRFLRSPDAALSAAQVGDQPPGIQPPMLAMQQTSGPYRSLGARSLRNLDRTLRSVPAAQFPWFRACSETQADTVPLGNYREVTLRSTQLLAALRKLHGDQNRSAASRIGVAFSIAISALSGNPKVAFKVNFSNRYPEVRDSVGCFFQEALVAVDSHPQDTVADVAATTDRRFLGGALNSRHSYLAGRDARARIESERGVSLRLATSFNCSDKFDVSLRTSQAPVGLAQDGRGTSLVRAECAWRDDYNDLFLNSFPDGDEAVLQLVAHKSVADEDTVDRLLIGMERFLVAWARDPGLDADTVLEVTARFGLPVTRYGDDWIYVDHTWVNTAKLARIMRSVEGVEAVAFSVLARTPQNSSLVAHIIGEPNRRAEIRAHVLTMLRAEPDLVCPHEFLWRDGLEEPRASTGAHPSPAGPVAPGQSGVPDEEEREAGELALCRALSVALDGTAVDLDSSYAQQGGRAVMAPAVIQRLERLGYAGPTPDDLLGPWPLRALIGLCAVQHTEADI
ncbi:hypothetical protein SAMN05216371_8176 [Streptomyces sp. TLI_053]|nr:hypothetical protein SAMN05216371_8176 [Streptomyces sp. TLI_053]